VALATLHLRRLKQAFAPSFGPRSHGGLGMGGHVNSLVPFRLFKSSICKMLTDFGLTLCCPWKLWVLNWCHCKLAVRIVDSSPQVALARSASRAEVKAFAQTCEDGRFFYFFLYNLLVILTSSYASLTLSLTSISISFSKAVFISVPV
jgi:hypothetical protein